MPKTAWAAAAAMLLTAASAAGSVWPSSHQRVADALTSGDTSERRSAAAKLLTLPPKLAKGLATAALRDGDEEVRLAGARAAAALGVERAGDEVIGWLSDRDPRLRVAACELIEASPTPASVQALARVLGDAQASVREAAAEAMGSSGMPEAVAPLLGHLDDSAAPVRVEVVRALGRLGDARAVVPLVSKLQDQEPDVRREAARALGQLGDTRATATLMLALQDTAIPVQVQALEALGKLSASEAVAAISALFTPETGGELGAGGAGGPVQDAALLALGRIASPEAVRLLVQALEREGPIPLDVRERAPVRQALVRAGKPAAAALTATLEASPSPRLASAAVLCLGALGAVDALPLIVRSAQRGAVSLDAALDAVAVLADRRALPFVLEHLDATDARVRQAVVKAALALLDPAQRDGRAVDVVKRRVMDLRAPVGERIALIELLGKTGSPRALPLLLPHARGDSPVLRVAAVRALGTLGVSSREVDATLLEALSAPSERLRTAAAAAIGRVGRDDAAHELVHRLGVSAEQDREAIGIGLSGALAHSKKPELVEEIRRAMAAAPGPARDALIEGLGRMKVKEAGALLAELGKSPDADDRRKVAEAFAGHFGQRATLMGLLRDPDPAVRANAVWSLGRVGDAGALGELTRLLGDLDVAVAGNAGVALARVARRVGKPSAVAKPLCAALDDYRPYVRAGALTGLRLAGASCPTVLPVTHLLRRDGSWRVRLAAATLLLSGAPGGDAEAIERALWRCSVEDRDALVAERCSQRAAGGGTRPGKDAGIHDVMVFVVPDGKTSPSARAPFALVLPDGSMRLGVADRRGALFEQAAPAGRIELAVPAALAR